MSWRYFKGVGGMWLSLQIALGVAAGILIAYVLIFQREALSRHIAMVLQALFTVLIFGGIAYGLSTIPAAVPSLAGWIDWGKVGSAVGFVAVAGLFFTCAAISAYALRTIAYAALRKPPRVVDPDKGSPLFKWGMLNFLIVSLIVMLLDVANVTWFDAIDRFSRENGMADGLSLVMTSVFFLWPLPILGAVRLFQKRKRERDAVIAEASPT